MPHLSINPPHLFSSVESGFSQIVVADSGKMIYISGQVAWDSTKQIFAKHDLEVQTQKAFENLETAIRSVQDQLSDIVMLRIYIVEATNEKIALVGKSLRRHFHTDSLPASTWVGVQRLAHQDFLVETEAQAIIHERTT